MAKPTKLPEWDSTEVNSVEPDATHKAQGWLNPNGTPEKPPFQTFNFYMNNVWKWLKQLNKQGVVEWDGNTTYDIGDMTKGLTDGKLYQSLVDTNVNNDPEISPTQWVQYTYTKNESDTALALKANDNITLHNTNTDETKIGSLTIGESISITSVTNDGTNITLTVASHNAKAGDTIYVSGLDAGNGTFIVGSVTATTIVYASTALATTATNALVKYGELKDLGGIQVRSLGRTYTDVTADYTNDVTYVNNSSITKQFIFWATGSTDTNRVRIIIDETYTIRGTNNGTTLETVTAFVPSGTQYRFVGPNGFTEILELS